MKIFMKTVLAGAIAFLGRSLSVLAVALLMAANATAADWIYVVSDGDNLWNFSKKHLGSAIAWEKVQKVNRLPDPNWIRPGTKIRIPMEWLSSNSVPATVRATEGDVSLVRQDGSSQTVQPGTTLELGDKVSTGDSASVSIEFADKTVVSLEGNSEISLDHLSAYGETGMVDSRLRLLSGRLETRVTPMSGPGSRFEIKTASAISAVRGTEYRMNVIGEDQRSGVEVTGGVVGVSDAAVTASEVVKEGFGTVVDAGGEPLPPRSLLPAPEIDELPDKLDRITYPITWQDVQGAKGYKVQLADSPDFEILRWQKVSERPASRMPEVPDGSYHLRVRAIDELGLEGMDRIFVVVQDAHPQPPVLITPADAGTFLETAPGLTWSKSMEASSYRVQVASDPDFTRLVVDEAGLKDAGFEHKQALGLGTWYWRTASIAADGEQGPYGAVRNFRVKPTPPTPVTEAVADETSMTVSWQGGTPDETYRVQVARDSEFKRIILDETASEASLTVDFSTSHRQYLRVQAIDAEGDPSAWGAVQEIPVMPNDIWKWVASGYLVLLLIAL